MGERMRKWAVRMLFSAALLVLGDPVTGTFGLKDEPLPDQVFMVGNEDGTGTGFLIEASGLVLTNQHVAGDSGTQEIISLGGGEYTGQVLETNRYLDLALVRIEDFPGGEPLVLSDEPPERMEKVLTPVWTDDHPFEIREGTVQLLHQTAGIDDQEPAFSDFMISSTKLKPGMSGSPVIRTDTGEVIAVNTAIEPWSGISLSIPVTTVREVLDRWIGEHGEGGTFDGS
ncbi:S1 family peptidase [Edaphobacillus lindanitolerans]|uniref:Serine protease Do n=1 Tax=Edaphobacillus lindanitolerans TaxID=550447 RepID=A0A1U7PNT8_9BACI|nr:serine protease [Edaphobacillus lindanitolerans]SIT85702.1 serine protease Do [Edaphobacillus lindanitolerans]